MHWLDIVVGVLLLASGAWSFVGGLSREVLVTLGSVGAFVLAVWGYAYVSGPLDQLFASGVLRQVVGFGVIVLAATILTAGWTFLVYRVATVSVLSPIDRGLGGLFGIVKVSVMMAAMLLVAAQFFPDWTIRTTVGARCMPALLDTAQALTPLLPKPMREAFRHVVHQRRQAQPTGASAPVAGKSPAPAPDSAPSPDGISESDSRALERILHQRLQEQ
jgi:membrane protein required for colicin V production